MRLSKLILRLAGWKVDVTAPNLQKCIICVAPHTSNWDFIICKLAYASVGRTANFLMKKSWFFFPLGSIFRAMGGIPVDRSKNKKTSLVDQLVEDFDKADRLQLAITPEGTRKRVDKWRTGFLQIAYRADVPCILAGVDYATKTVTASKVFQPTGDINADMQQVKDYYKNFQGKHPELFSTNPQ